MQNPSGENIVRFPGRIAISTIVGDDMHVFTN